MTLAEATAFVERSGIALVFPVVDLVLPSLWEEVLRTREVVVFVATNGQVLRLTDTLYAPAA